MTHHLKIPKRCDSNVTDHYNAFLTGHRRGDSIKAPTRAAMFQGLAMNTCNVRVLGSIPKLSTAGNSGYCMQGLVIVEGARALFKTEETLKLERYRKETAVNASVFLLND